MQQEHLANGTPVFITQSHRFGQDALLLAHFCRVRRAEAVCDLGTGCGVIGICRGRRWFFHLYEGNSVQFLCTIDDSDDDCDCCDEI